MFTDRRANSLATRRVRQPWPKDKPFRILSLDGGGIRGVYTAALLQRCEEEFGKGEKLARYFDMIAGTSTGGIIALGLGLGISTPDIVAFYRDDGRRIFPPLPLRLSGKARQLWNWAFGPKLNHEELDAALKCRFGENLLGQSSARLVIPAFMMPKTEIAVFKTDHHADFRNDHLTPMWKVARATSAAPTYAPRAALFCWLKFRFCVALRPRPCRAGLYGSCHGAIVSAHAGDDPWRLLIRGIEGDVRGHGGRCPPSLGTSS